WLAGLRYFRFEDNLLYASSLQDSAITRAGDDMYYEVNTSNDLFGAQLGSRADYCMGTRVNLYGTVKAGIYNNHSRLMSSLGTDMADAYLNDTRLPLNTSQGQAYRFDEMKDEVAFLSELGTGVGVRVSSKWTATFGYRAVIASGVATSPDNVKTVFANYEDIRDFNNRGTLVLHGVNMGALYNY
ncbi:MAG: BBP7 family outer membrane beta-barrel protein, partial [Caldilineaceae bacterium]|nr:BBP7 family outer membrane beta-barrel protein [Caldilineaceae bacterium]